MPTYQVPEDAIATQYRTVQGDPTETDGGGWCIYDVPLSDDSGGQADTALCRKAVSVVELELGDLAEEVQLNQGGFRVVSRGAVRSKIIDALEKSFKIRSYTGATYVMSAGAGPTSNAATIRLSGVQLSDNVLEGDLTKLGLSASPRFVKPLPSGTKVTEIIVTVKRPGLDIHKALECLDIEQRD